MNLVKSSTYMNPFRSISKHFALKPHDVNFSWEISEIYLMIEYQLFLHFIYVLTKDPKLKSTPRVE
jgi:hypothetical protein